MGKVKELAGISMKKWNELLSLTLSRNFNGDITANGFNYERLSPNHRKSQVFRFYDFSLQVGSAIPNLPPWVIAKSYSPDFPEAKEEYETEKLMLGFDSLLKYEDKDNGAVYRVYPDFYSERVPECDDHLVIIRQYIPEKTLLRMLVNGKKKEEITWEEVAGALEPIALLHVSTPWLKDKLNIEERVMTPEKLSYNFAKHFARLHYASTGEHIKNPKEVYDSFRGLAKRHLFNDEVNLMRITNGDLTACPHHTTNNILLDGGNACFAPLLSDVALYSDPIFGKVVKDGEPMSLEMRCKESVKEYLRVYDFFADKQKVQNELKDKVTSDSLEKGWYVISLWGLERGSSAISAYKLDEKGFFSIFRPKEAGIAEPGSWEPRTENIEKEVTEYLDHARECIRILKESSPSNERTSVDRLEREFDRIPQEFKFKIGKKKFKEYVRNQNSRLSQELK